MFICMYVYIYIYVYIYTYIYIYIYIYIYMSYIIRLVLGSIVFIYTYRCGRHMCNIIMNVFCESSDSPWSSPAMTPSPAMQHGQRFTFNDPNGVDTSIYIPMTFPPISQSPVARKRTPNRPAYVDVSDVSDRRREDRNALRKVAKSTMVQRLINFVNNLLP